MPKEEYVKVTTPGSERKFQSRGVKSNYHILSDLTAKIAEPFFEATIPLRTPGAL